MLRFFRQYRKNSFLSARVGKYTLYAVGEIILVVIGILIALQVNNWNEKRKDHVKSIEFHQRLVDDLEMVISFLDGVVEYSDNVHEGVSDAVEILEKRMETDSTIAILDFALSNFYRLSRHLPELTSYNEMKSTGQLDLIYNGDLRKEIEAYIVFRRLVNTAYEDLNTKVNQSDFLDPYVKYGRNAGFLKTDLEYDFDALSGDQEVINTLSRYAFHWTTKIAFSRNLKKRAEELFLSVNQELSNLQ
jgi:hypothetical protein